MVVGETGSLLTLFELEPGELKAPERLDVLDGEEAIDVERKRLRRVLATSKLIRGQKYNFIFFQDFGLDSYRLGFDLVKNHTAVPNSFSTASAIAPRVSNLQVHLPHPGLPIPASLHVTALCRSIHTVCNPSEFAGSMSCLRL